MKGGMEVPKRMHKESLNSTDSSQYKRTKKNPCLLININLGSCLVRFTPNHSIEDDSKILKSTLGASLCSPWWASGLYMPFVRSAWSAILWRAVPDWPMASR